jgi:hypothetical protein
MLLVLSRRDCVRRPAGGTQPFAQELLDEKVGIFAAGVPLEGGLEEACRIAQYLGGLVLLS